jgi:hypothetical protein
MTKGFVRLATLHKPSYRSQTGAGAPCFSKAEESA